MRVDLHLDVWMRGGWFTGHVRCLMGDVCVG